MQDTLPPNQSVRLTPMRHINEAANVEIDEEEVLSVVQDSATLELSTFFKAKATTE